MDGPAGTDRPGSLSRPLRRRPDARQGAEPVVARGRGDGRTGRRDRRRRRRAATDGGSLGYRADALDGTLLAVDVRRGVRVRSGRR